MDNIEFGKYMASLREKAGFDTQAALSKVSEVESSTISRIETGDTKNPNIGTLRKLAPHLGVPIETIMEKLGYIVTKTKYFSSHASPTESDMLEVFLNTDDEDLKLFERIKKLSSINKQTVVNLVTSLEIIDKTQKEQSSSFKNEVC